MFEKKQEKNNNSLFMIIIIVLLAIISILAFFVGKNYDKIFGSSEVVKEDKKEDVYEKVTVELIGDKRNSEISLEQLQTSLGQLPSLSSAEFVKKDFSDAGVKEYMAKNEIKNLPAVIFSTKNFDNSMDRQNIKVDLRNLKDGRYKLEIGAKYDPNSVNEKGFMTVEGDIVADSYIKGDEKAKISILEYTDIECPYCIQLHQTTYLDDLLEAFPTDANYVLKHFPLNFHPNAKPGAELLECFGEQKGSKGFYDLVDAVFAEGKSDKDFIIEKAVELGANKETLEKCLDDSVYATKVDTQMASGTEKFKVSGTPTVIFYNNETGEYVKASRNIITDKGIIEKLLK